MHVISKLCQNDLVVGLPKLSFDLNKVCDACVQGKHKKSFLNKKIMFPLLDLCNYFTLISLVLLGQLVLMVNHMALLVLMIFQDIHRYYFYLQRMKYWICSPLFIKLFKMKKVILFQALEMIMEKNLKILVLMHFVVKWN